MLSHRVGSSNRADLQRMVALEQENAELRQRVERQQLKCAELTDERDRALAHGQQLDQELARARVQLQRVREQPSADEPLAATLASLSAAVALQTQRRERAEADAQGAVAEAERLQLEIEHLREQAADLSRELASTESQWRDSTGEGSDTPLHRALNGRRILYVGGRPSSTPTIRDLVQRHGGEFQRHDGGIEDRKGLLVAAIAWAHWVVFPVDCVDHDSALALKRICTRQGIEYKVLRTASVTSFVAALAASPDGSESQPSTRGICLKNG
jgi:regulator of replication initiation timing